MRRVFFIIFGISMGLVGLLSSAQAAFQIGADGPYVHGFAETACGIKMGDHDTKHVDYNMIEQRLQLKTTLYPEFTPTLRDWAAGLNYRGDFLVDEYFGGKTSYDIRELHAFFSPFSNMDVKIGRQVFTWGTGDYLFVNDLFPKDYVSFYIGREDEYLKKPSDGVRVSLYWPAINIDFVAIPFFEPNTIFTGDRLSFFDSFQGGIAGRDSDRYLEEPARQGNNTEYAIRAFRTIKGYEVALYGFRGFDKMPRGYLDESRKILFYPRLDAVGASIRGQIFSGIGNIEGAYYRSQQDSDGNNRTIDNSLMKYLIGYSRDLGNDWSMGVQYLYEQIFDYDNYQDALLVADYRWDEYRHVTTLRITKLFKKQTVRTNLFIFFSPSDMDTYWRPSVDYDVNDAWKVSVGANLVWGRDDYTEFGQMEHNKNIYIRARYSF